MLIHWMKQFSTARRVACALLMLMMGGAMLSAPLSPSAQARPGRMGGSRGGGFGSFGSRGSRSFNPGLGRAPMQALPRSQGRDPIAGAAGSGIGGAAAGGFGRGAQGRAAQPRGSWLQRNPLLGGLAGAIAGTVIGSMLVRTLGGLGGGGSFLLFALVAFGLFMLFRKLMERNRLALATRGARHFDGVSVGDGAGARQTPYSAPAPVSRDEYLAQPVSGSGGAPVGGYDADSGVNTQTRDQGLAAIALGDPSMTRERLTDALTARFFAVQEAWSQNDRMGLTQLVTGELNQELGGQLADLERRGERNILKNIAIRRFDISEAWQEGDVEFATAHISARLIDYTERGGQIVEGNAQTPTDFAEFWTFVRMRGRGEWILSAINQEA